MLMKLQLPSVGVLTLTSAVGISQLIGAQVGRISACSAQEGCKMVQPLLLLVSLPDFKPRGTRH